MVGRQNSYFRRRGRSVWSITGLAAVLLPTKRIMPFSRDPATVCTENSNPDVMMVKPAEDWG
jgi:hypothetical protein